MREDPGVRIEAFPVGPLQANAYVLIAAGGDAAIVDPGADGENLLDAVRARGGRLTAVWLTHAHFDHVGGLAELMELEPVPVYLHPDDRPLLEGAAASAAAWDIPLRQPPTETRPLAHGQTLVLGGTSVSCLHTPGHAPGHIAFHLADEGVVLTGDALFRGSIGRTDLPLGDAEALLASIRDHLMTLPDATRVLPGHGGPSTIGAERATNPFLQPGWVARLR